MVFFLCTLTHSFISYSTDVEYPSFASQCRKSCAIETWSLPSGGPQYRGRDRHREPQDPLVTVRWASDPAGDIKEGLPEDEHEVGSRLKPRGPWHGGALRGDVGVTAVMSWPLAHADSTPSSF